jgi:hypothetical protein
MKLKSKIFGIALITALQAIIIPVVMADFLPVRAYGTDTVAGYAAALRTSLITPGQNIVFVVEKPDMSAVRIPAQADLEGVAEGDLYGHQTKIAGDYRVAVVFPGSAQSSPQSTFKVYADQVSVTQSDMTSTSQMVNANGEEKTFVTVTLYDAYRNPIANHQVQLISSRGDDTVTAISNGVSDKDGRANFKVTSKYSGISTFTAIDATVNKVLSDREEVVFFAPVKTNSAFGGNLLSANLFQADIGQGAEDVLPGPVNGFEITGLPSTVKVNTDQTLTVTAKDKNGNVAKNYTGTVLFSTPDDEHAILPNNGEYTFKESDQGKFTFNLALRFTQLGNQVLQVFDKENWKVSGEWEIEVVPEKAVVTAPVSKTLNIKSPVDGAELGATFVIITGQGDENINLKVFDNDTKIGDSETDSDGFFSYQAQNLQSGAHTFYVMSEDGDVSPSVSIQIDTIPPVLNFFEVDPDGTVSPGVQLTITAQSEPNLQEAKVRIQGIEEPLPQKGDQPGTYTATVAAPVTEGIFPIDVILIDGLSNKTELLNKAEIQVFVAKEVPPPKVQGVEGAPGDGEVILTWYEVTGHETGIQNYRIYFGTAFDDLDQTLDADGAVTSVTIGNLENDKQYFFAVKAVDAKALESKEMSTVIAITPTVFSAEEEEEVTVGPDGQPTVTIPPTTAGSVIQGTSLNGTATLNWQPFTGVQAYFYKVYFGLQSGRYDDYVITSNNIPAATVQDLIPGLTYYFAVAALDLTGREVSSLSQELALMPAGTGFHAAPYPTAPVVTPTYPAPLGTSQFNKVPATEETGPETVWLIMISIIVAYALYHHKRRILNS